METFTTNNITVTVVTRYLPEYSNPVAGKYIFGYHILIENGSPHTVQLLRRRWLIQDEYGFVREVEGAGVVGEQPILEPGASHEYTSYCDLNTEIGQMGGTYLMTRMDNESFFDVRIPVFLMVYPARLN